MSRTRRFIPTWTCVDRSYMLHWQQMYQLGYSHTDPQLFINPRDALSHGYDGPGQTYYLIGHRKSGWKEPFQGASRRFYKRYWHKGCREWWKRQLRTPTDY